LSSDSFGWKDGKIVYVKGWVLTNLERFTDSTPYSIYRPVYDQWQDWVEEMSSKAPPTAKSILQTNWAWPSMLSERAFVTSAITGVGISMTLAFCVLLVATRNLIQSFLSILCVSGVILSIMALIQLNGWELGISESAALGVSIGLSVDYVVHLSADYMHSPFQTRFERMQQSYKHMGISILSGSITTIGSALFLLGGQLSVFYKFGILISSTIAFSFILAMLLFGALSHIVGAQGSGFCGVNFDKKKTIASDEEQGSLNKITSDLPPKQPEILESVEGGEHSSGLQNLEAP